MIAQEISILHSVLSSPSLYLFPVVFYPGAKPALVDSGNYIFRIGAYLHLARLLQSGKTCDDRGKLHSVVRGFSLAAGKHLFVLAENEYAGVSARAGVALASPVGIHFYLFHNITVYPT